MSAMKNAPLRLAIAALAVGAGTVQGQSSSAVIFRGSQGTFGVIEQRDLTTAGPAVLPFGSQPVRLLPLEVNGRTELNRVSPSHPWRHDDVPGASRIQLPADLGSVFHYELDLGASARAFGFFLIDPSGVVRPLFQLPGTGPASDQDPFLARIGIASDGGALVCATTVAAGGNLLELDVPAASASDRTAGEAPRAWVASSLFLAPQWGVAVHAAGVHRFARTAGSQAVPVSFGPGAPTWFPGDVALSANGAYAALLAGASAQLLDVYVLAPTGSPVRTTPSAGPLSPAGYLPEQLDGPFLAVSDDGNQCAWRTEGLTREAFLARVPWQSATPAAQLTSDTNFLDTIDEVGQYGFQNSAGLHFTAGERDTAIGGIDNIDVYRANIPVGGSTPSMVNLSLSSGVAAPPFVAQGEIKPEGAVTLPGATGRLLLDREAEELVLLAPQGGGVTTILPSVKDFDGLARSGNQWILALRRSNGNKPRQIVRWTTGGGAPQVLFSSDSADALDQLTLRSNMGAFLEQGPSGVSLRSCNLATGQVNLFSPRNFLYGPALSISSAGEIVGSLGAPGFTAVFVRWLPPAGPKRLAPAISPGFVLRGL